MSTFNRNDLAFPLLIPTPLITDTKYHKGLSKFELACFMAMQGLATHQETTNLDRIAHDAKVLASNLCDRLESENK